MGTADRTIRAVVMGALYFTGTVGGTVGLVLVVLAVVFLGTSFVSFCPLYLPIGLNTGGKSES